MSQCDYEWRAGAGRDAKRYFCVADEGHKGDHRPHRCALADGFVVAFAEVARLRAALEKAMQVCQREWLHEHFPCAMCEVTRAALAKETP